MAENLPYSAAVGTLEKVLEKIKTASEPDRVTQNFVKTKLGMKGGSANACIPFLKKMGFVASDGTPTDLYKEYRNPKRSRMAIGQAFRKLYERLYEMNEYVHDAEDQDVLGLIVQCTGSEKNSRTTQQTISTFNMLRKLADFEDEDDVFDNHDEQKSIEVNENVSSNFLPQPADYFDSLKGHHQHGKSISLAYTINLNLPATKDIEVFDAIFKSLKEHILEN